MMMMQRQVHPQHSQALTLAGISPSHSVSYGSPGQPSGVPLRRPSGSNAASPAADRSNTPQTPGTPHSQGPLTPGSAGRITPGSAGGRNTPGQMQPSPSPDGNPHH